MAGRRPADWRVPTEGQARAEETSRRMREAATAPRLDHDCWWDSVLADPRAQTPRPAPARSLDVIWSDLLRVECLKFFRIVEIKRDDPVRIYGANRITRQTADRASTLPCLNER